MDNNKNITENETGTETANRQEKTFTQEEVNDIIQKRLAREKGNQSLEQADREKELDARELQLTAREKFFTAGIPSELGNLVHIADEKSIDDAISILKKYVKKEEPQDNAGFQIGASNEEISGKRSMDQLRKVMGLH